MQPTNEAGQVAAIQRAIQRAYPEAWVLKTHGGGAQRSGVPDLLVVVEGQLVGLEVKHRRPGESERAARARASVQQLAEISRLQRAGARAAVVLDPDEALEILREVAPPRG